MTEPITFVQLKPQNALTIRRTVAQRDLGNFFSEIYPKIRDAITSQGGTPQGAPFARYYNADPNAFDTEAGLAFTGTIKGSGEMKVTQLPGGKAAKTLHIGPYETLSQEYMRIGGWLDEHGEKAGEGPWETYVSDPKADSPPRTEVYWPIRS